MCKNPPSIVCDGGFFMKSVSSLFAAVILVAALGGIIYPAFIEGPSGTAPPGVTYTVISLFLQPHWTLAYFMRAICVLFVTASGYLLLVNWLYHKVPITVVRTRVEATLNADKSKAVVRRNQTLRANQSNVTAYFSGVTTTSSEGLIPESDINMSAFCLGRELNSSFWLTGTATTGFDIMHEFGCEIPYRWWMLLIPGFILGADPEHMHSFFRRRLVTRKQTYTCQNEYNGKHPTMQFSSTIYPHLNVSIRVNFEGGVPDSLRVNRIKSNGVTAVSTKKDDNFVEVLMDRMQDETLMFRW